MAIDFGLIQRMIQEREAQVPQASDPGARRRLAEAEALRQRRLRQDQVNAELAQRKLEAVQRMSPEAARQRRAEVMADPARPGNSPVMEPHIPYGEHFHGEPAVGPIHRREAAYDVVGQYQNQLRGAVNWNKAVNEYSIPLPMKTVDPQLLTPYRNAIQPYPFADGHSEVSPESSIRNTGDFYGEVRDDYGTRIKSPIRSKYPSMRTSEGSVYAGAENPFELTPSPYSLSQFGQAMQRRFHR